jgi:hypothetical protein
MNLLKTLQSLRTIQPDQAFSDKSRRDVLMSVPTELLLPRRIFTRFVGAAGSLVLAGILIFIIAGGLSATDLAPKFSSIDPVALRAEAQAIDTQINLLNVSYTESPVSTAPTLSASTKAGGAARVNRISLSMASSSLSSSTPAPAASLDDILQGLSE